MEIETAIWELSARQHGLVGKRQLNALGIDHQRLRPLLQRKSLTALSPEVFVLSGSASSPHRSAMAATLDAPPGALLSHQSAAGLWGLPGFRLDAPFHVTIPRQGVTARRRLNVIHYHKDLPLSEVIVRDGIPVATPALTLFQLAAVLHPARTERAVDNALARRLVSARRFHTLVQQLARSGRNGSRLARELAANRLASYKPPESGFEARVQWCADSAGVAVERQVALGDSEFVGRADFRLVGLPGVIEAQSLRHHSAPLDQVMDTNRSDGYLELGMSVLFVWDHQVFHSVDMVVDELRRFRDDVASGQGPFFRTCGSS